MKIINYQYSDPNNQAWFFPKIDFRRINLIVGNSGAGKSRFINTIFSLGANVVRNQVIKSGNWIINFEIENNLYYYELIIEKNENSQLIIKNEHLINVSQDNKSVFKRSSINFTYLEKLPKLPNNQSGIFLLKEEEEIGKIFNFFSNIMRRDFGEEAIKKDTHPILTIDKNYLKITKISELPLVTNFHIKLNLLKINFKDIYDNITNDFKSIFPFVNEIDIRMLSDFNKNFISSEIPVAAIKEKGDNKWVPINEISTGMFKVLLILTDLYSMPDGSIYIIDEYENSLGVNAIHFLPELLYKIDNDIQIFITSHHPYLINKIPIENWIILNRKGTKIEAKFGEKNKELYGKSKHDQFTNLLNDPFYNEVL